MGATNIEWADKTWNPVTGCTPISTGCRNCYAQRMAENRLRGRCGYDEERPFKITYHARHLYEPLSWRKPGRVFVASMGDLFHDQVDISYIHDVLSIARDAALKAGHRFFFLTKRPDRMREAVGQWWWHINSVHEPVPAFLAFGVTAENQEEWDRRVPVLMRLGAVNRFVSCEPLLGYIRTNGMLRNHEWKGGTPGGVNWVIAGAETGPQARSMDNRWAVCLKDQCQKAGVPFFFKRDSAGRRTLEGRMWEEMP